MRCLLINYQLWVFSLHIQKISSLEMHEKTEFSNNSVMDMKLCPAACSVQNYLKKKRNFLKCWTITLNIAQNLLYFMYLDFNPKNTNPVFFCCQIKEKLGYCFRHIADSAPSFSTEVYFPLSGRSYAAFQRWNETLISISGSQHKSTDVIKLLSVKW